MKLSWFIFLIVGFELVRAEGDEDVHLDRIRVSQEAHIVNSILKDYNPEVRPVGNVLYEGFHRPVVITVNMFIRSINNVDDKRMQLDVQMTLRQKWRDERLAYSIEGPDSVTLKHSNNIWTPDTFFAKELTAHRHVLEQPNTMVRIKRDGSVLYSTRISVTLFCPMQFTSYPFDNQTCKLNMASYAYTEDDIVYAWDKNRPIKHAEHCAASSYFHLSNITHDGGSLKIDHHTYSFVTAAFHLQRKLRYYVTNLYIPSVMLVVMSWFAFLLHPSNTTTRTIITLGALSLLTITTFLFSKDVPTTSYPKSIDIWMGVSVLFAFAALLETVLASRFYSADQQQNCETLIADPENQSMTPGDKWNLRRQQKSLLGRLGGKSKRRCDRIDHVSRVLFPSLFMLFAVLYMVVYWLFA